MCAIALLGINLYICRDFFWHETAYMNSMHGYWIAMAKLAGDSWFRPSWWPYWDTGIPFEFTYAPLIPGLTALWSSWGGISLSLALQRITGIIYCLAPLTMFFMAWVLTRAPGYSFAAVLIYSLFSPTQLIAPDPSFAARNFWDARRLYLISVWDDAPHLAALALLPLIIVFLWLSLRERRLIYYGTASVLIALATSANMFGPVMTAMAAVCVLLSLPANDFKRNLLILFLIGIYALAVSLLFLSPSLILAIPKASGRVEGGWTPGSFAAMAIILISGFVLYRVLLGRVKDGTLRLFGLFAFLTSSIPVIDAYLHWRFIPQPSRYKMEMELALPLAVVFGLRPWLRRTPLMEKAVLVSLCAFSAQQIASHAEIGRNLLRPSDAAQTLEYRTAKWIEQNLPGMRVMLPGSIASWANAFTSVQQLTGGSWSTAYNQIQQSGFDALKFGPDPQLSLVWVKAFGVGAIAVSGPKSPEYWKPFAYPGQFEGVLPVLRREDDVTIYGIPQSSTSLAHIVPQSAIVQQSPLGPSDVKQIARYVAALEDPSMPSAGLRWEGRNRIHIHASAFAGQALSVQVSYHPGWHAKIGGKTCEVKRDGLGLMWMAPQCGGPCDLELNYDGGREFQMRRYISVACIGGLFLIPLFVRRRHA